MRMHAAPGQALSHSHPWRLFGPLAVAAALGMFSTSHCAAFNDAIGVPMTAAAATGWQLGVETSPSFNFATANDGVGSGRTEIVGWSKLSDRSSVGASFGVETVSSQMLDRHDAQLAANASVGLRWRSSLSRTRQVDLSAWRSIGSASGAVNPLNDRRYPSYGTRLEMQLRSAPNQFAFVRNAFGIQLGSNARLDFRSRHGGPLVYYRAVF